MGQLFKGQVGLKLLATVGQDITGTTCKIKYKKPDQTTGDFTATIVTAETGVIQYVTTETTDINMGGEWTFWGHVVFTGGGIAAGEPVKEYIYEEGQTLM